MNLTYLFKSAMKRILLAAMVMFATIATVNAQTSNAVFFTENGEGFYVIMNGLRMNDQPATNVKVTDLNQPGYKVKIIFEDSHLGEFDKNIYFNEQGVEVVYVIKKNKKGLWKLGYQSAVPLAQAPPPAPTQSVIVFGAPAPAPVQSSGTMVIEETTTTTTTTTGGGGTVQSGDNVSMNVNVGGFGMDVNVTTSENGMNMNSNSNVTHHHTTTTTTTTTTTGGNAGMVEEVYVEEVAPCYEMPSGEFASAKNSIRSKSFSDSKMTLAKQITKANCLSASQVRQITELFDFESDKLEYAKFAFDYCPDKANYYKVNDAFTFESSIEELDEYIHGR